MTHGRLIDADALMADCQLAQKQADRHGREFANAFYSGGGEISTEWWCVEDMIENAPTIEERKWIPCSERLPQPNEEDADGFIKAYLVQDSRWMDVARWNGDCWIAWGYGTALTNVIAWMPLPEPYAERRTDE